MSIPTFNIGGLASGLDTNSIVSQLIQLERIPIVQIQQQRATYQARNDAWSQISTRINSLQEKIEALDTSDDWKAFASASSSNTDSVGVSVSGSPDPASVSFTVDRLATTHQMVSTGTGLTSGSDLVGAGTFSITVDGTQHDITTDANTTLSQLASDISALGVGVTASVITVDTDSVRLLVSSDETGDASAFTITSDQSGLSGFSTLQTGQDAQITLGSGGTPLTIERASNSIDDLIDGVTLDLTATTASAVTVTVGRDLDAAVDKITEMVNEMNSAISLIESKTKTATESGGVAGPLSSDSTARSLKLSLRSSISGLVSGLTGSYTTAGSVGISLTRTGAIELDETKLRDALEDDFAGVKALFARTTSATDSRVAVTRAADSSLDGTHAVSITQAGTRSSITGSAYVVPGSDDAFTITSGGNVASVTVTTGSTIDEAITAIETALSDAGITTISVSNAGGAIELTESRYGSSASFEVSTNGFGLDGTHTGTDVVGTIGGVAGDGSGRTLLGTGDYDGLNLSISATAAAVSGAGGTLDLGSVSVVSGLAATFAEFLDTVTETGGLIDRATDRWDAQITLADDRIEQLEARLELREVTLRRQYTALETTLAQLQSVSTQLSAGLGSLGGLQQ